jgi:two-component system chemotaxis response regulator CheB
MNIVVIGASWGGIEALKIIFSSLTAEFPLPVAVVLHRGRDTGENLCPLLQKYSPLKVKEAEDKEAIMPGNIYIAPADYHLIVEEGHFALSIDEQVNYARPSIDVLFESAADSYKNKVTGVILTGANRDGTDGMKAIKSKGGFTIVQDTDTAESRFMPESVIKNVKTDRILPLNEIGHFLWRLTS